LQLIAAFYSHYQTLQVIESIRDQRSR